MKPTVTEIAADLQLRHGGCRPSSGTPPSRSSRSSRPSSVPELSRHAENASAAILSACTQPQEALKFARYLAAPDRGGKVFEAHGFKPAGGDKWAEKPEMILYSGGVNRPAIEKLLVEFADREGVTVTTVFNGCGILCAAMKTMGDSSNPKFPDAYYACDVCFVPPVAEHFPEAVMLTETDIVIAVPKGNPKNVKHARRPRAARPASGAVQRGAGHARLHDAGHAEKHRTSRQRDEERRRPGAHRRLPRQPDARRRPRCRDRLQGERAAAGGASRIHPASRGQGQGGAALRGARGLRPPPPQPSPARIISSSTRRASRRRASSGPATAHRCRATSSRFRSG